MSDEIKEILEDFKKHLDKYEGRFKKGAVSSTVYEIYCDDLRLLLDYITNLQQENQQLKENNQAMQEEMARTWEKENDYKSRVEKAIEYIKWQQENPQYDNVWRKYECESLINILQGSKDK